MTIATRTGFVRAAGTRLVDEQGPLLLRGVGLGNWLLPEGYMWRFGTEHGSPRQIEAHIRGLVGDARANEFWARFRDEFITAADFAMIAQAGFDHVRLPISARGVMAEDGTFIEAGFELIERAVALAERHGLRTLLDLHGAPGGQTGTNIDDSPRGLPDLFIFPEKYREQTIRLWQEIARRYRDRESVLGYDLLNEPLPNEWQHTYAAELTELYRDLTAAIREIDQRHLLVYEGSHWSTNWQPISERFDDNQLLQFHRYWCAPDVTSIQEYLDIRDELQTPIYMGEGGENTAAWIYAATRLYERHDIGWNLWPWKKLDTITSPLSARLPADWHLIADADARPSADDAWRVLDAFLAAVPADACDQRPGVLDALFARGPRWLPAWAGASADGERVLADVLAPDAPESLWRHTSGAPYDASEIVPLLLPAGETLVFPFASRPASWTVDADAHVDAEWDGTGLVIRAPAATGIRGLTTSA